MTTQQIHTIDELTAEILQQLASEDLAALAATIAPLPDDPVIHRCVLAYASDMGLLDASLIPHGRSVFSRNVRQGMPR